MDFTINCTGQDPSQEANNTEKTSLPSMKAGSSLPRSQQHIN